jgi:hypothetical protein
MKHINWVMAATFLACGPLRTVPVQEEGLVGACREAVVFDHVSLAMAAALVSPESPERQPPDLWLGCISSTCARMSIGA